MKKHSHRLKWIGLALIVVLLSVAKISFNGKDESHQNGSERGTQIVFVDNTNKEKEIEYFRSDNRELDKVAEYVIYHLHINLKRHPEEAVEFAYPIANASLKYGVPIEYIIAIIATESSFRKHAVSNAGAIGTMQVIPEFWDVDNLDPTNFEQNIMLGTYILKDYTKRCGGWECAFKAYNVGITNFRKGEKKEAQKRYMKKINTTLKLMGKSL